MTIVKDYIPLSPVHGLSITSGYANHHLYRVVNKGQPAEFRMPMGRVSREGTLYLGDNKFFMIEVVELSFHLRDNIENFNQEHFIASSMLDQVEKEYSDSNYYRWGDYSLSDLESVYPDKF